MIRPSYAVGREGADGVAGLRADVRARGDAAVGDASAKLDWPGAGVADLAVPPRELDAAVREVDPGIIMALQTARENCTFFHRNELTPDWEGTGAQGWGLGIRHLPVSRAGLHVPGGLGS